MKRFLLTLGSAATLVFLGACGTDEATSPLAPAPDGPAAESWAAQIESPNLHIAMPDAASRTLAPVTAHALMSSGKSVLVYGPTLSPWNSPGEDDILSNAGNSVTVASAATWGAMTTSDFAAYDAIVIPEYCTSDPGLLAAAEANRTTWSPAVSGNVVVILSDPLLHHGSKPEGLTLVENALDYALAGGTGLYVNFGCLYFLAASGTPVPVLDQFGALTLSGQFGCPSSVTITDPAHPVTAGLTDAGLSNWGCSPHGFFESNDGSFDELAVGVRQSDGAVLPWLLAGGSNNPQTKDDCKNGGWADYGFKNQGQCVRFVETGKDSR